MFAKENLGRMWFTGVLICTLLVVQSPAFAGDWNSALSLKPGDTVVVTPKTSGVSGPLRSVDANSITVAGQNREMAFSRADVQTIYRITPRQKTYENVGCGFLTAGAGFAAAGLAFAIRDGVTGKPGPTLKGMPIGVLLTLGSLVGTRVFMWKSRGTRIYSDK